MRLDLTRAFVTEGFEQNIDYVADLSSWDAYLSSEVVSEPIRVAGRLYNRAGILCLEMDAEYVVSGGCDRCCEPVSVKRKANTSVILVREKQDEDSDGLVLADGDFIETDDIVAESIMLDIPSKILCSEDCKGLCPMCGQNLNLKKCDCKKQQSPFDILKQEFNG